jgi:hypothetical protein
VNWLWGSPAGKVPCLPFSLTSGNPSSPHRRPPWSSLLHPSGPECKLMSPDLDLLPRPQGQLLASPGEESIRQGKCCTSPGPTKWPQTEASVRPALQLCSLRSASFLTLVSGSSSQGLLRPHPRAAQDLSPGDSSPPWSPNSNMKDSGALCLPLSHHQPPWDSQLMGQPGLCDKDREGPTGRTARAGAPTSMCFIWQRPRPPAGR